MTCPTMVRVAAFCAACLCARPALGDERPLRLEEAITLARDNNRDLAVAKIHLQQSAAGVEQAWVALMPTVTTQAKYTHNYKSAALNYAAINQGAVGLAQTLKGINSQNPGAVNALNQFEQQLQANTPSTVYIQKEEQLDASVHLTVPIVVPSAYASLTSAKRTDVAAQANFKVTQANLLLTVAQGFYAAAGADELLVARTNAVALAQQTLHISQAKLAAGTAKRTDVNQAEVALLRAQQAQVEAQDTRDQAYRALGTLLQVQEPFKVAVQPIPEVAETADALVNHALALRPEFHAYDATAEAYDAQSDAAGWQWAPTLSGFGSANIGNYSTFTGNNYAWALGLQLDWALFDGGARDAKRHIADSQAAETRAQALAERDTVRDAVKNALSTLNTKRQALNTAEQSVQLANETLTLMRVQYDAGTATQVDVLTAQDSLVSAEVAQAQAHFDLALAKLSLDRSAGLFPEVQP